MSTWREKVLRSALTRACSRIRDLIHLVEDECSVRTLGIATGLDEAHETLVDLNQVLAATGGEVEDKAAVPPTPGSAGLAQQRGTRLGSVRPKKESRIGQAWNGGESGQSGRRTAWHCKAGKAWRGVVWGGEVRQGVGSAGMERHGRARQGEARRWQARNGAARLGAARSDSANSRATRKGIFHMSVHLKKGSRLQQRMDAAVIEAELQRIYQSGDGVLEARRVWLESRDPSAPLHGEFTWDDAEAADKYRDQEARKLIQCVEIVREDDGRMRGWAHVVVNGKSGYQPMVEALSKPDTRLQVIAEARRDLLSARHRMEVLEEFASEREGIDNVLVSLARKEEQPQAAAP